MFRFATPWMLLLVPVVVLAVWRLARRRRRGDARLPLPSASVKLRLGRSPWGYLEAGLPWLRGVVLLRTGDAEEARVAFEATLAIDSEHRGAQHNISLLDEMKRRLEQGEVVIEGK